MAKRLEVEAVRCSGFPKAKRVDGFAAVPHNRAIVGHTEELRGLAGDGTKRAFAHFIGAIEPNLDLIAHAAYFPRIMARQPIVGIFDLPSVMDGLFEHAVFVP